MAREKSKKNPLITVLVFAGIVGVIIVFIFVLLGVLKNNAPQNGRGDVENSRIVKRELKRVPGSDIVMALMIWKRPGEGGSGGFLSKSGSYRKSSIFNIEFVNLADFSMRRLLGVDTLEIAQYEIVAPDSTLEAIFYNIKKENAKTGDLYLSDVDGSNLKRIDEDIVRFSCFETSAGGIVVATEKSAGIEFLNIELQSRKIIDSLALAQ